MSASPQEYPSGTFEEALRKSEGWAPRGEQRDPSEEGNGRGAVQIPITHASGTDRGDLLIASWPSDLQFG